MVAQAILPKLANLIQTERIVGDCYRNTPTDICRTSAITRSSSPIMATFVAEDQGQFSKTSAVRQQSLDELNMV